ncbi:MAG TPA: hypothetical protein VGA16_03290 [Candidatus Limnocylindria bacterium]
MLRLSPIGGRDLGAALAEVDAATLARRDGAAYADVPVALVPRLARALAFAGIAVEPCDADLEPPAGLFLASGRDLRPLPGDLIALDVVRVRRVALGRATREVLRRRLRGVLPASASARRRCRELLRRDHVLFEWDRRAWAARRALRSTPARASLRPVVFDRDLVTQDELRGRTTSREVDLGRWLFA